MWEKRPAGDRSVSVLITGTRPVSANPSRDGTLWAAPHGTFGFQVRSDRDKFVIFLDVKHFSPEDLTVKVQDDFVEIHGKHNERQVSPGTERWERGARWARGQGGHGGHDRACTPAPCLQPWERDALQGPPNQAWLFPKGGAMPT